MSSESFRTDPERLDELIEEDTIDCYNEDEQHSGLLTMVEGEVVFPFEAKVMGDVVRITGIKWNCVILSGNQRKETPAERRVTT